MVDRPSCCRIGRFGDSLLSGSENPAPGSVRSHLSPVEQFRMLGDEGLEFVLRREALPFERFPAAPADLGCRYALPWAYSA